MKRNIFAVICLMALLTTFSCNSLKSTKPVPTPPQPVKTTNLGQTEDVIEKVIYGDWFIARAGAADIASQGAAMPSMTFTASPERNPYLVSYTAFDGCNYNNGMYSVTPEGQMRRAGEPVSTMKFCGDSPYELAIVNGLNTVSRYAINKQNGTYELFLINEAGDTTLMLRKNNIDFINGAWTAGLIQGVSVPEAAEIQLVIDIPQKTIHGNAGCNMLNGKIVIENNSGRALRFTDMATTRMTCPEIETEQRLLNALNSVTEVRPGPTSESAVLLDSNGNEAVVLYRLNL